MSKYEKIDLKQVNTISIEARSSKVEAGLLAQPWVPGGSFARFMEQLPDILVGRSFRELVEATARASSGNKPVIVMMGAHVIKCGLNPVLIDLMERGIITALAMNGAGAIHDTELALWGQTSEDVVAGLQDGTFGMVRETGEIINGTALAALETEMGFGEALGKRLLDDEAAHQHLSVLARGYELSVPVTVHVAIGTDIVHQQPTADGRATGELSFRDFRVFARQVAGLTEGAVVLNLGSAVVMPEVFLKALTVARNLGHEAHGFVTANFDMLRHYRPRVNVVQRPTQQSGRGHEFTGHHEIMIPLFAAAVKEALQR